MKVIDVADAANNLRALLADAIRGEYVVLKDGEAEVSLHPRGAIDPELDSPELEAQLAIGLSKGFSKYSADEMRSIGNRILNQK